MRTNLRLGAESRINEERGERRRRVLHDTLRSAITHSTTYSSADPSIIVSPRRRHYAVAAFVRQCIEPRSHAESSRAKCMRELITADRSLWHAENSSIYSPITIHYNRQSFMYSYPPPPRSRSSPQVRPGEAF